MPNTDPRDLSKFWLDACRSTQRRIVFPESTDLRTIEAVGRLVREKAAKQIFFTGSRQGTLDAARGNPKLCADLESGVTWTSDAVPDLADQTRNFLERAAANRGKNVAPDILAKQSSDPLYQAGTLMRAGLADCALAGAVGTTSAVIRAAIATVGIEPGLKTVSGSFIMEKNIEKNSAAYLYADAGVVIDPTLEQLVDIASASVKTWTCLVPNSGYFASGKEPVVAFLSFSTKGSAAHPAPEKMALAARLFQERHPHIAVDGELQFDAAIDPGIAARKCPSSPAAGRANIFIFPNLESGNIAYKITQRLGGFHAYGPILQGLAKPYSDLSRGSTSHDIFMSALGNLLRA